MTRRQRFVSVLSVLVAEDTCNFWRNKISGFRRNQETVIRNHPIILPSQHFCTALSFNGHKPSCLFKGMTRLYRSFWGLSTVNWCWKSCFDYLSCVCNWWLKVIYQVATLDAPWMPSKLLIHVGFWRWTKLTIAYANVCMLLGEIWKLNWNIFQGSRDSYITQPVTLILRTSRGSFENPWKPWRTSIQRRRTPLPQTKILPQWLPELIREGRLCGNGQQVVLFQDRAYDKQSHISPTSQKQSPVFSSHTEPELPIDQQEPCAADWWKSKIESTRANSHRSSTKSSARTVPVTTQDRLRGGSPQGLRSTGQL